MIKILRKKSPVKSNKEEKFDCLCQRNRNEDKSIIYYVHEAMNCE